MLKITPAEIIPFVKVENELVGTVEIQNIVKYPITYKVMKSIENENGHVQLSLATD